MQAAVVISTIFSALICAVDCNALRRVSVTPWKHRFLANTPLQNKEMGANCILSQIYLSIYPVTSFSLTCIISHNKETGESGRSASFLIKASSGGSEPSFLSAHLSSRWL